ncbi:MAG: CDP-alcohol phosphatidyltransferase [Verrucomicrobiales bacterium]|nr:CDP-alcohol phosphatidyltransferase [Verrucomicrobiales bacterium]
MKALRSRLPLRSETYYFHANVILKVRFMENKTLTRRPIAARDTSWARKIAGTLAQWKVSPNTISILSIFFATLAGVFLLATKQTSSGFRVLLFALAIVAVQCRLLCNLFDGMVAVEGGMKSKLGELYNEFPDRLADSLIIVAAGYAARDGYHAVELGWLCALCAVITAYVRTLGASAGGGQQFCGPMAKQQRMALISIACGMSIIETLAHLDLLVIPITLIVLIVGMVITIIRRLGRIAEALEKT